jgi:glutamate racemase
MSITYGPIGLFDSGFGGITVLKEILKVLPQYDYLYLGDNARVPYGPRSYEIVCQYTLECVDYLFVQACPLIILACNTATAKALRNIQQKYLPIAYPERRVLGVIRPVTELAGSLSQSGIVGVLATSGTVSSLTYPVEMSHFSPQVTVVQEACPMWVPLVENDEYEGEGADYFVRKHLDRLFRTHPAIDTLVLGCTHYPMLGKKIRKYLPQGVQLLSQGEIVAHSLKDYLQRHPDMEAACQKEAQLRFLTTDSAAHFNQVAGQYLGIEVQSTRISLPILPQERLKLAF